MAGYPVHKVKKQEKRSSINHLTVDGVKLEIQEYRIYGALKAKKQIGKIITSSQLFTKFGTK